MKNPLEQKLFSLDKLKQIRNTWSLTNQQVVFTNGCFDILHLGHVQYLFAAKQAGHKLIVALNTDASVKRLKGPERPINDEHSRAWIMACLGFVDAITLFEEDTPLELIKALKPDVLVKGADYKPEEIVGYDEMLSWGGQVKTIDLTEGFSTTSLIEKMKA